MSEMDDELTYNGQGLDERDEALVKDRALELARIGGREMWNKVDLDQAMEEIFGNSPEPLAPEIINSEEIEAIAAWDEPVASAGHEVARTPLENEEIPAETLILEGIEEADHSLRIASIDEEDEDDQAVERSL